MKPSFEQPYPDITPYFLRAQPPRSKKGQATN